MGFYAEYARDVRKYSNDVRKEFLQRANPDHPKGPMSVAEAKQKIRELAVILEMAHMKRMEIWAQQPRNQELPELKSLEEDDDADESDSEG